MTTAVVPALKDLQEARRRIQRVARRTPFIRSSWLSTLLDADVWLKLESAQVTGAFKIRGATNAVLKLVAERPQVRRVLTASAGNHGRAIAFVVRRVGLSAQIFVPETAPEAKRLAIARLGAEIIETASYDEAEERAHATALDKDTAFISAYSDPDVIAGAGTIALEMFEDLPELDTIIAPTGGGGLLSGLAIAARSRSSRVRVVGAEVEASPVFTSSLAAGRIVTVTVQPTLADGLAGNMEPDSRTFDLVRQLADGVVSVAESSVERAMRDLIAHERLVVEGAGATAVGALLQGALDVTGQHVGVVLTGRNVDAQVIARLVGTSL